ncbi:ribbon-helix-helix protein, CopG family [Paraburkholderia fungorum]|uniref:ribbon-helix-helix protein, CopG family n=1 Tax=Paraburkholderia fungorum TaxID=134537 RepID=UPI003D6A4EBC
MAKTTISAKIDPDRLARLDRRVAELGITRTSAIETAVDAWLDPPAFATVRIAPPVRDALAAEDAMAFALDGEPDEDPDKPPLDLAADPSNPWGV